MLGVLPGLLGTLQANEAIKYLVGLAPTLENTLLMVEALSMNITKIQLAKNPECAVCSREPSSIDPRQYQWLCTRNPAQADEVLADDFAGLLDDSNALLIDVRTAVERQGFHLGGEHIPLDQLQDEAHRLPKDKPIICYCQSGIRSRQAVKQLLALNYAAKSLKGGVVAYLKKVSL